MKTRFSQNDNIHYDKNSLSLMYTNRKYKRRINLLSSKLYKCSKSNKNLKDELNILKSHIYTLYKLLFVFSLCIGCLFFFLDTHKLIIHNDYARESLNKVSIKLSEHVYNKTLSDPEYIFQIYEKTKKGFKSSLDGTRRLIFQYIFNLQ